MSTTEAFMKLTTWKIEEPMGDEKIIWEVTVMGPQATMVLLNLVPEGETPTTTELLRKHYYTISKDIVYPSIVSPKIPLERLSSKTVSLIFPVIYQHSFPEGDEDGEFRSQ